MAKKLVKKGPGKKSTDDKPVSYSKGPTYLKQNPKATPEQNEFRAKENIQRALQFKQNLRGVAGVNTQYTPREVGISKVKFDRQSTDIGVQQVDPVAIHKADSVLATRNPGMLASRKKIIRKK
jgi:hypothetical protein